MRTITFDDLKRAAATLDPEEDNHGACKYTRHDGGHCVVGTLFVALDLPVPKYRTKNNTLPIHHAEFSKWLVSQGIDLDAYSVSVLKRTQEIADQDSSWVLLYVREV